MKVVPIKKKNQSVWKIEGEAFDKIKAANRLLDKTYKDARKETEKLNKKVSAAKEELWKAIYAEIGLDDSVDLNLDESLEDMGIYIIKKNSRDSGSLASFLSTLRDSDV